MNPTLNRNTLRNLIIQEIKSTLIKEQQTPQRWEDINLRGLVVTGRPRLKGVYTVSSDGSFQDLQGDLEFEVTEYSANPGAVGSKFTLNNLVDYHKGLGENENYSYEDHDIWPNLVRAAEESLARVVTAAAEEADSPMVDTGDASPEAEVEEDFSDRVNDEYVAQRAIDNIQGVSVELPESDVRVETGSIRIDPAVPERVAERIAGTMARELADTDVSLPLGVAVQLAIIPSSTGRASIRLTFNGIDPDLLGDVTTSPVTAGMGSWSSAEPIYKSDERAPGMLALASVRGEDVDSASVEALYNLEDDGIIGYVLERDSDDEGEAESRSVLVVNSGASQQEIDRLVDAVSSAYSSLTNRQRRALISASEDPAVGSSFPIVIDVENADPNANI